MTRYFGTLGNLFRVRKIWSTLIPFQTNRASNHYPSDKNFLDVYHLDDDVNFGDDRSNGVVGNQIYLNNNRSG